MEHVVYHIVLNQHPQAPTAQKKAIGAHQEEVLELLNYSYGSFHPLLPEPRVMKPLHTYSAAAKTGHSLGNNR